MERAALLRQVSDLLGDVQLVWFGTRGDDVESVADLDQLSAAFSIISRYRHRSTIDGAALEDLSGVRVDLDTFDIDADPGSETMNEFRRALLRTLSRPSAVLTYRPSMFLSAACFARQDQCRYIGMFNDHQSAFEHKPWVETEIAKLGIPRIEWKYVADDDQLQTLKFLENGPVILRRSRTNGGVGLVRIDEPTTLKSLWLDEDEAFVSVAPYIAGGIPMNVNGVVWHDGVTLHPASLQLIGVPECTTRPFGYCGNDFTAAAGLDRSQLSFMDDAVRSIGGWLGRFGYLGAFGVDFLIDEKGVPLFTEVNPRLQGSTHASSELSVEWGLNCVLLEHIAALLGIDAPHGPSLLEFAASDPELAHFIVHWTGERDASVDPTTLVNSLLAVPETSRIDVVTRPDLRTEPGATVARVTARSLLTRTGFDLSDPWRGIVNHWNEAFTGRGLSNSSPSSKLLDGSLS
jgi:hypothetical protein